MTLGGNFLSARLENGELHVNGTSEPPDNYTLVRRFVALRQPETQPDANATTEQPFGLATASNADTNEPWDIPLTHDGSFEFKADERALVFGTELYAANAAQLATVPPTTVTFSWAQVVTLG